MEEVYVEIIKECLRKAGLDELPNDIEAPLKNFGMDSLMIVLTLAELEKHFKKNISVENFSQKNFETIKSIINYLINEKVL